MALTRLKFEKLHRDQQIGEIYYRLVPSANRQKFEALTRDQQLALIWGFLTGN